MNWESTYAIEGETCQLGKGAGLCIKMLKENLFKLKTPIEKIKKFGTWEVEAWLSRSTEKDIIYGKVGPVAVDITDEEIFECIKAKGYNILEVTNLTTLTNYRDGDNNETAAKMV